MTNQIFERLWLGLALCLTLLFTFAVAPDRMTWDQGMDFVGAQQQLAFAAHVLSGTGSQDFRSIDSNYAFYGIGTTLPAYALSWLIDVPLGGRFHTYFNSFTLLLHLFAFLSALAASRLTGALVKLETGDAHIAEGAAVALLLVPPWIGYGFFDYKDMPVALGVIACVAFAARCREPDRRALLLFFAALLFLGAQKLAAVPLALPACAYVGFHVLRRRNPGEIAAMAGLALALPVLLYAVTPPPGASPSPSPSTISKPWPRIHMVAVC